MVAGGGECWKMAEMYMVSCRSRGLAFRTIETYESGLPIGPKALAWYGGEGRLQGMMAEPNAQSRLSEA